MNLAKAEVKMAIAESFGKELFERVEKARSEVQQYRGATVAYKSAEKEIDAVSQSVSELAREGKLDVGDGGQIAVAKLIVGCLMRASRKVHDLGENAAKSALRAEGVVVGFEQAAMQMKARSNEEAQKLEQLRRGLEDGSIVEDGDGRFVAIDGPGRPRRTPGMHPGLPMKAQRKAEEANGGNGAEAPSKPAKKKRGSKSGGRKKRAAAIK